MTIPSDLEHRLRRPAQRLVVAGGRDALFSVAEVRRTDARYQARFELFPKQPHNLMIDGDWQAVAALVHDWL